MPPRRRRYCSAQHPTLPGLTCNVLQLGHSGLHMYVGTGRPVRWP